MFAWTVSSSKLLWHYSLGIFHTSGRKRGCAKEDDTNPWLDRCQVQSTFPASMNPHFVFILLYLNCVESRTHSCAIPAFLTAEETALIAQQMAFRSWVRSPVASGTLRCSESTKRVSVIQFVSIEEAMINRWCLQWTNKRCYLSS